MASVCASGSSRSRLAVVALCATSCGALHVDPGGDFAVSVLDAQPIRAVGRISVPIRVSVSGCGSFRTAVSAAGTSHAIDVVRDGDAWLADVPVDWIRGSDGSCLIGADAAVARRATLDVTCDDAGRTASAAFELSYATADRVLDARSGAAVRYLYPGGDRPLPWALAPVDGPYVSSLFTTYVTPRNGPPYGDVPMTIDPVAYSYNPLDRPRLATTDQAVFVTSGCADPTRCPPIEVAPGVLAPSELIYALGLTTFEFWSVYVPGHVMDIAPLPSGELLVVSDFSSAEVTSGRYTTPQDTVVSRLALNPWPSITQLPDPFGTVQIVGYYPDEIVKTWLSETPDGRFAFISYQHPQKGFGFSAILDVTDGYTIERTPDVTSGAGPNAWLSDVLLSPDASTILLALGLGPPGATTFTRLPADQFYPLHGDRGGASWGPDAIALWEGTPLGFEYPEQDSGSVEAFELAPPHARLFRYDVAPLPGSTVHATIHGAAAVGDHFVVTTNTGVRILDRSGKVVGGADPLPCRMSPTAIAIANGPSEAAVGTIQNVLLFDVSKL